MSENRFVGGAQPPERARVRVIPVRRPKVRRPLDVVFLAGALEGYWTHPTNGPAGKFVRSELCVGAPMCPYCAAKQPSVWMGFAATMEGTTRALVVAALTLEAAHQLPMVIPPGEALAGARLKLERVGESENGPVRVTWRYRWERAPLPGAFEIGPSLQRLFDTPDWPGKMVRYASEEGGPK